MLSRIFAARRSEFLKAITDGVAIIASAPLHVRNGDVEHEYRQDSHFYYLTGWEEPDSICVLAPGNPRYQYILFVRPKDPEKERWTGLRSGVEGAMTYFGADMAYEMDRFEEIVPEFLWNTSRLYYQFHRDQERDQKILSILKHMAENARQGNYPPGELVDSAEILSEMRIRKTEEELLSLRRAAEISSVAHTEAMKAVHPGMFEYQLQAILEYGFRMRGSRRNGYPSILASGPNACVLHYTVNSRQMQDGDLILVDAGAEFEYYTADITRTYPVNGKFTAEQKAVYEIVLHAQKKAIETARPGIPYDRVHQTTLESLTEGMIHLGLLSGSIDENLEQRNYEKYFYHRAGHWLGMDVHDPGKYRINDDWRTLETGMVLTVEPGLYIAPDDEHERFRGIGIRIEDDVLVTETNPIVLSAACPKEVEDLEQLIGSSARPFA